MGEKRRGGEQGSMLAGDACIILNGNDLNEQIKQSNQLSIYNAFTIYHKMVKNYSYFEQIHILVYQGDLPRTMILTIVLLYIVIICELTVGPLQILNKTAEILIGEY